MSTVSYWSKWLPALGLSRKRRTKVTINPFSLTFGESVKQSLYIRDGASVVPTGGAQGPIGSLAAFYQSKWTFDMWVKPLTGASAGGNLTRYLFRRSVDSTVRKTFNFTLDSDLKFNVELRKSNSVTTVTKHDTRLDINEWNHIGVAYDGSLSIGQPWSIWVNGIEKQVLLTANTVANLYAGSLDYYLFGPDTTIAEASAPFYLDEVRLWNTKKAGSYFQGFTESRRGGTPYGTDSDLKVYYKFNDTLATTLINQKPRSVFATGGYPSHTDDLQQQPATLPLITYAAENFPNGLGSCYPAGLVDLSSIGAPFSFKYPTKAPSGINYSLAIQWIDSDGNNQIRWLWRTSGLVTKRVYDDYAGEKIEYAQARLNIWPDYLLTALTGVAQSIDISLLSDPTDTSDDTQPELAFDVSDKIYSTFPCAFPITFNQSPVALT